MTSKIIDPARRRRYPIKRFHGRGGYYIAKDPHGRYVKVKKENVAFIPGRGWQVFTDMTAALFYEKGVLTELLHPVTEITSRKHAQYFESPRNMNIGKIFGRAIGAKKKKMFF